MEEDIVREYNYAFSSMWILLLVLIVITIGVGNIFGKKNRWNWFAFFFDGIWYWVNKLWVKGIVILLFLMPFYAVFIANMEQPVIRVAGLIRGLMVIIFGIKIYSAITYNNSLKKVAKKCPFCAERIKVEAKVCKHCGKDIETANKIT